MRMPKTPAAAACAVATIVALALPGVAQAQASGGVSQPAAQAASHGWSVCKNPALRYSIEHPRHWHTAQVRPSEKCRQFDPEPFTVPPNSEYPITAMNAVPTTSTVKAYIAAATDPMFAVTRLIRKTTVNGRHAIQFETVATGEGLYPQGLRTYGYAIDRNDTAFIVFTTTMPKDPRYHRNKDVINRAACTLRFRR